MVDAFTPPTALDPYYALSLLSASALDAKTRLKYLTTFTPCAWVSRLNSHERRGTEQCVEPSRCPGKEYGSDCIKLVFLYLQTSC